MDQEEALGYEPNQLLDKLGLSSWVTMLGSTVSAQNLYVNLCASILQIVPADEIKFPLDESLTMESKNNKQGFLSVTHNSQNV